MAISRSMNSDPIDDIRTIIRNHYDSNSILKELIQNARDAGATTFYFKAVKGNSNANHELLKTDALVVFNDGNFDEEDADKITNIGSSHKLGSKSNVGKYGLGMKSIFHYCDAFFYVSTRELAIVNPWKSKHAKTHASWDNTSTEDDKVLLKYFNSCQTETKCAVGFMLYIPLRNNSYEHYISNNMVEIESLWQQPFDANAFKKDLVNILAVLPCTIDSKLQKIFVDTPQIKTKLELKIHNSTHNEIILDSKSSYHVYFKKYEEKVFPKLLEIKRMGKLPEKTEYDEDTDTERVYSPYNEQQTPTIVSILHENKGSIGNCSFQFCCYLPLDDKNQVLKYKNACGYDCDIFIHSEFETDGGRKSVLGVDFSKDRIIFPVNSIPEIVKEDQAQHWWNISIIQELLSVYLPDFISNSIFSNIKNPDTVIYNYYQYIQDVYNKNSDLIELKHVFYKKFELGNYKWNKDLVENIDSLYIEANKFLYNEIHLGKTIEESYSKLNNYILVLEKFLFNLNVKHLFGTTHITLNDLFTEKKFELLLQILIDKKIPIIFSPDFENKIQLTDATINYLSYFFEPFKESKESECSDILNSFSYEKEDLLKLCQKYSSYPICLVHNIREKNPAKNEYITYENLIKLYNQNCLYSGYLQNVDYLIHSLTKITDSLTVYSISDKNILSKLFQDDSRGLLDVNTTSDIFSTINSSNSVKFTQKESLLLEFFNKIDSYSTNLDNYLSTVKFIITNIRNKAGTFAYCDCQESDLYTKLFSKVDEENIFITKSLFNIFKQKNIPVDNKDSYTVKSYLSAGKQIDFSVFTSDEKDRFLLTLAGDTFKHVPLHKTIDDNYISFTDTCYLIVDETIKLPAGYNNDNISFIKLSSNRELQERQKEILKDSILTESKALEILFNDENLDLTESSINTYLKKNIKYADISLLNLNQNFRCRDWIELSSGKYCSPNKVINLDSADKNISLKNLIGNIYTVDDLNDDFKRLNDRKIYLETADYAAEILLRGNYRKIDIDEEYLLENWELIKSFVPDKFYQIVDCIYDNDKRKRSELLYSTEYVEEGNIEDYARFISNLSKSEDDYSILIDLVHLCIEKDIVQENLQSFLSIPTLQLPTENGGWNFASNISNKFNRSFSKKQQLNQSLVDVIEISEEDKAYVDQSNFETLEANDTNIKNFFTKIIESKNEIDPRLLGLLLFLLAGKYRNFAENNGYFTDTDKSVLRENIPFTGDYTPEHWISKCSSIQSAILNNNLNRFTVILQIRKGKSIETKNLCNSVISVAIANNRDGDILSEVNLQTPYNQAPRLILQFLYDDLSDITARQLKNAIQYVYRIGYYQRQLLDDFYEKLLVSEQASIECTKRGIFKEIFGTLKILKLKEYFSKEFDDYNESNYSENNNDKQIILDLQKRICDKDNPEIKERILSAVRDYLSDNQYDSTRILYELLQNADDAVGQQIDLLDKTGKESKDVCREFKIEKENDSFIISHYGREINFRPSDQFPNSYKYDLSNMIQISNSDKPGQLNTTGKFGLGFKSVYFLCNQPIIRSGRLQFKIIAGLYPEKCELKKINKGETRIELKNDRSVSDLFLSFEKNIELSIIFSKFIRTISLLGKEYTWNPNIKKYGENVVVEWSETFTVLRLKKDITLVFQNNDQEIIPLADKFQKIWHITPLLDEFKYLPYALNCQFEVDTGRKSLAKGHKNDKIILDVADVIADSLIELHKNDFKNVWNIVTLLLASGLKSEDVLAPISEKLCEKLYISCGIIPDGYNGFAQLNSNSRIFSISETCMENYVNESSYSEFFKKVKTLLSIDKDNILISDVSKTLCRDNIKKYCVEKENLTRFNLVDYLYYADREHKISSSLFSTYIDLDLYNFSNTHNEILNDNAKLLASDGKWYSIRDIFNLYIELDESYSPYLTALKDLIKIKEEYSVPDYSNPDDELKDNNDDDYDPIKAEFDDYVPTKTIQQLYDDWHSKTEEERKKAAEDYYANLLPDSVDFENFVSNDVELSDSEWFIIFLLAVYQSRPFCRDLNNKNFLNQLDALDKTGHLLDKLGSNKPSKHPQIWIDVILDFLDGKTYDQEYFSWFNEFPKMVEMAEFKDVYMQVLHDLNKLPEKDKYSVLTPEALNEYSGSGLRKAPTIDRTVRIGFSLIIRELIRKGELIADPKIEKFAYMPKSKCIKFILGDVGNPHFTESEDLYRQIVREIGQEKARFDGYYDIPLLIEVKPGERS